MTSKSNPKENNSEADHAADEKLKKEELVEAKMRMIRKKNEELMRRQREIEEDRKNADLYSEMAVKKNPGSFPSGVNKEGAGSGRGRGRGRGLMLKEMRKETLKAKQWEAKRRENIQKEEEERKKKTETSSPSTRFLVDNARVDMSKTSGRNERSWGGANFNQVINRVEREKQGFWSPHNKGNVEMTMSGKERREYSQWREERMRIDEERKARQKKTGSWSRAWDQSKSWDPRKKMWVDEIGDHSCRNTRWQDSDDADDWGSDNRNRRRDHGQQEWERKGSRGNSRFARNDYREVPMSEDWGKASEKSVVAHTASSGVMVATEEEWGDTDSYKSVEQLNSGGMMTVEEDWGDDSSKNTKDAKQTDQANEVMSVAEEWCKTKESKVSEGMTPTEEKCDKIIKEGLAQSMALGSMNEEAVLSQPHDRTTGSSSADEKQKDELCATENGEISSTSKEGDVISHSNASKPQRRVKQRRRFVDSDDSDQINDSKGFAPVIEFTCDRMLSHENHHNEPVTPAHVHTDVTQGDQDEKSSTSEVTESHEDKERNEEKIPIDAGKGDTLSNNSLGDKNQGTTMPNVHPTDKETTNNGVDETVIHKSGAEKTHLPKIITKVEKKVTFDSEKNENVKETDVEDSTSLTIGDIPPTPDFLKFDHSLEWGDIEVEADDSVTITPKW